MLGMGRTFACQRRGDDNIAAREALQPLHLHLHECQVASITASPAGHLHACEHRQDDDYSHDGDEWADAIRVAQALSG